ncbi:proline-rich protein 18 [Carcharodon carcharias]|uniref:proline-rich protein 18 n=1 Tax=Carcharodon carcharias TaxID=13397 RepID=UPI001B7E8E4C|nr:proline-rich protein 18 [Carcharodon carcharias]
MKTGAPARTYRSAVPFPPIHPAVGCPGRRQVIPRGPRTGQPAGPAPPAGPPGRFQAAPRSSFSNSWPEAKLKQGGRRPQPQPAGPGPLASSNDSGPASSSGDSARRSSGNSSRTSLMDSTEEMRFSLSLTPEAVRVIQRRSLERQLLGKGRGKAPAPARSSSKLPAKPLQPASGAPQARSASGADIRSLVKISLLNDQHKYDDVEYEEEEDVTPDPALLRRCMEWLQGVEAAARLPRLVS